MLFTPAAHEPLADRPWDAGAIRTAIAARVGWLLAQCDEDGLWTQRLFGSTNRCFGPAHGFAGCALALGDLPDASETLQPFAVEAAAS